jgi:hypothetical protein
MTTQFHLPWRRLVWAAAFVTSAATGCSDDPPQTSTAKANLSAPIGQCERDEVVLRNPVPLDCSTDLDCPCGSHCDLADQTCRFECMVPPANKAEACPANHECDDRGECVRPNRPPASLAPVLTASPSVLSVQPRGVGSQQLAVQLALFTTDTAVVNAARTTAVRVVAGRGLTVSCDATTFGDECRRANWTFVWDGTAYRASQPFWVKTAVSNTTAMGKVTLLMDAHDVALGVPSVSGEPPTIDGTYIGVATTGTMEKVAVDVRVHGSHVIVRDPARIIAPDGALVLDLLTSIQQTATSRTVPWLKPAGGADGANVYGQVTASEIVTFDAAAGTLTVPLSIALPGSTTHWQLALRRTGDHARECTNNADCGSGSECPDAVEACVPTSVWTPPAVGVVNQFEDPRSQAWWNAISPSLGTSTTTAPIAAFDTTRAELVETVMCTNSESSNAGRLGVRDLKLDAHSRSGDLTCISGLDGATASPGAIGFLSYADRKPAIDSVPLLNLCLQDLARGVTTSFSANFSVSTGDCANLARFLPALRLLTTDELGKGTRAREPRTRGLFVRLVQQWSLLHGFIASIGLSERDYDDAVASTPAEARQNLISLLDTIDAGWAALLDKRVAPTVTAAATWAPTATDTTNDYRLARQPVVYWPFNSLNPQRDVIRNLNLTQRIPSTAPGCQLTAPGDSIESGLNCPGFVATLPADAPSIGGNNNLTVSFHASPSTAEFAEYRGGTLFQTETLAGVAEPLGPDALTLTFVHPTADGGTEWVSFEWLRGLDGVPVAIMRDTAAKTYTLYVYESWRQPLEPTIYVQRYRQDVGGVLPGTQARRIQIANGNTSAPADAGRTVGQFPHSVSYYGAFDDFAIWDSVLSVREFKRFAWNRQGARGHSGRTAWPTQLNLTSHGAQEIQLPVGAALLEMQAAQLEVVARLTEQLRYDAQVVCEGGDTTARTGLDAGIARAGQSLRQAVLIDAMAAADTSPRAADARNLITAKRSAIARALHRLTACANPYGMADTEVPLYFGDLQGETAAFFAASDHLLDLAVPRAAAAETALTTMRSLWDQARASKIQQLQSDTSRATRIEEIESSFGEELQRLCGIADLTGAEILAQVRAGEFSIDTCYVANTLTCRAQHSTTTIGGADPTCYRGTIGGALMDVRASFHAQQSAYQAWQAALGDADGAEQLCLQREIDALGCVATRSNHRFLNVECDYRYQGTVDMIEAFNDYLDDKDDEQALFGKVVGTIATVGAVVAATVATGPAGGALAGAAGAGGLLATHMGEGVEKRRRRHEQILNEREIRDELRTCWETASQHQRAIAAAEEASLEASDRMQSASIAFQNAVSEAREAVLEGPVVYRRELDRPTIPIAFHYWLPETMSHYRFLLESARRYTYMALRATEYDTQETFKVARLNKPWRGAVLSAWRPQTLVQQLGLMRAETDDRRNNYRPAKKFIVLDLAKDLLGITVDTSDPADPALHRALEAVARPVYSKRGEFLGRGIRFSFLPADAEALPTRRCAERLWRANAAAEEFNFTWSVKLLKSNLFASRSCSGDGFQVATLRPEANLLAALGDPSSYEEPILRTPADINMVNLADDGVPTQFHSRDDFTNGSSTELAGQGMYGDYVLLFPSITLNDGALPGEVHSMFLRFDYLSIDATPQVGRVAAPKAVLEKSALPIVVD